MNATIALMTRAVQATHPRASLWRPGRKSPTSGNLLSRFTVFSLGQAEAGTPVLLGEGFTVRQAWEAAAELCLDQPMPRPSAEALI